MADYVILDGSSLKDYQRVYPGGYINASNGLIRGEGNFCSTSFTRINPGDILTFVGNSAVNNIGAFYDSKLNYLAGITKNTITAPDNAKYFRIGFNKNNPSFTVTITSDNITDLGNDTLKDHVLFDNSVNTDNIKEGYTIHFSNGNELAGANFQCTADYIDVSTETNLGLYALSLPTSCGAFYNDSNAFVAGIDGSKDNSVIIKNKSATKVKFGWNKGNSAVLIGRTVENVVLNGGATDPEPTIYTITNNLKNVTTSNSNSSIEEGLNYSANLTANSGYEISSVSVTMGGADITSKVYSNGTISITSVTGDIIITATATKIIKTVSSISASYTQGSTIIYPSTNLDSLKTNLVVTATYSDDSTATISSSNYSLSGSLSVGTSIITVSYSDKTATFNVTVSKEPVATINLVLSTTSLSINEGATGIFTVKLDKQPSATVVVNLNVNNSNCTINKPSLTFTTSNYSTAQTITVTGVHNPTNYSNLASTITVSSENMTSKTVSVTINNIDTNTGTSVITTSNTMILSDFTRKNIKTLVYDSSITNNYATITGTYVNYNNGELGKLASCNATDYIRINSGDTLELTGSFPVSIGCFYDSNKTYLSKIEVSGNSPYTTTAPTNAYYFRISFNTSTTCKIYITKNTADYSIENNVYLDSTKILYGNTVLIELLNELYKRRNRFKGGTWDVYGDSITEVNFRTQQNYEYFVGNKLGLSTINNYGVSGNGFKQLAATISEKTSTPNFITVFCGTNNFGCVHETSALGDLTDTSAVESVTGYIKLTVENLIAKYPNTPIGFFTPLPRSNGNSVNGQTNTAGYTMEQLVDRIIEVCNMYSIPVLDLYRCSNLRPWNSTNKTEFFASSQGADGLHPNVKAHENYLQYKILNFIETYL